jgi:hypothetical protein
VYGWSGIDLAAGRHKLRFASAGKPAGPTGFSFGLDAIDLLPPPQRNSGVRQVFVAVAAPACGAGAGVAAFDSGLSAR